jgi:hypothetical protein
MSTADVLTKAEVEIQAHRFKTVAIEVSGSGAEAEGTARGSIDTFDWTVLYELYGVAHDASPSVLVDAFRKDPKKRVLKQLLPLIQKTTFKADIGFRVRGNDDGIPQVNLNFTVLRVTCDDLVKEFIVVNRSSITVTDDQKRPYTGFTITAGP